MFGDDYYEVAMVESDSQSDQEQISSTAQASSVHASSSSVPESFPSFDTLRNTPEASSDLIDKATFKRIIQEAFQSLSTICSNSECSPTQHLELQLLGFQFLELQFLELLWFQLPKFEKYLPHFVHFMFDPLLGSPPRGDHRNQNHPVE